MGNYIIYHANAEEMFFDGSIEFKNVSENISKVTISKEK